MTEPVRGRYQLNRPLGRGQQGEVWQAEDRILAQNVAIKLFYPQMDSPLAWREQAALRRLDLPGVARLLDDGTTGDGPDARAFLVMELVEGQSWATLPRPMSWTALAPLLQSLLGTLRGVHGAGIVHRDLKPGHALRRGDDEVVLLDFGVAGGLGVAARPHPGGGRIGSLAYAAPEQLVDPERADARADLYAVGMMAYELLAGAHPFAGLQGEALLTRRRGPPPPPLASVAPEVPTRVASTIDALLTRRRKDRPASADEALRALGLRAGVALDPAMSGWAGLRFFNRDLAPVFAGPERIFGLRSRALRCLRRRAGLEGAALAEELSRWLAQGRARWAGGAVRVAPEDMATLERDRPAAGRGEDAELLGGLEREAREAWRVGDLITAERLLGEGLAWARAAARAPLEAELLAFRVQVALSLGTLRGIELGLYELDRAGLAPSETRGHRALLLAARAVRRGQGSEARGLLDEVPAIEEEGLDRWRHVLEVERALHLEDSGALIESLSRARAWARRRGTASARADLAGWCALLAYRQDRPLVSAAFARVAERAKAHATGRLAARANAASALLEAARLSEAAQEARALLKAALVLHQPQYAARAEWIGRAAAYRAGQASEIDWPLVQAARELGGFLGGQLLFGEAAIAWRVGRRAEAHRLAREVSGRWATSDDDSVRWIARCLVVATAPTPDEAEVRLLAPSAAALTRPGLGVQGLGLLAWASPTSRAQLHEAAVALCDRVPAPLRLGRRELITLEEAQRGVHTPPPRAI